MHILYDFPMPPSANKQLTISKGRMIKTSAARLFSEQVRLYGVRKWREIEKIKKDIKEGDLLQIDCYFIFLDSRLVGKKGQIKKLDANNFLKSCLDGVASILGIDDKYFMANHVEKIKCVNQSEEQAILVIRPAALRTLSQLTATLSP